MKPKIAKWRYNKFLLPLFIIAIPWTQQIISVLLFQGNWDLLVHPRSVSGISGILLSPISHSGFAHLIGNSSVFLIFSWLILIKSERDFWISLLMGWIGGGVAKWLLAPNSVHGLSGVVYALFGYLLAIGWLEKRLLPLGLSVFVAINYSHLIWGVFPTQPGVAWWGHLFGFLLGVFTAYGVYRESSGHH